jgi:3beta-hydroxy-delta5-steroid dehydrogenase/steroid delta-isomerase
VEPTADLGRCLVTGASGFLGGHLVAELARRGHAVRAFDVRPAAEHPPGVDERLGDVTRLDDVRKACEGIDTVFHAAARLVFLTRMRRAERVRMLRVNVGGVENVLRGSAEAGVRRLVYTSSNNVTLDGPVIDGDETTPYATGARDLYTRTKIEAERRVLAASRDDGVLTCAVRPGGIYGPGDPLILVRLAEHLRRGTLVAVIGDGSALSDNSYIDNLVDGEITAARHLVPGSPAGGQAYYITDGAPLNYFEFFRPFVEGVGLRFPRRRLPAWPLRALAWAWEVAHQLPGVPPPLFTRLEVRKMTVSHYNRIDKARRDLGWRPPVARDEAVRRCLPYLRQLLQLER